MSDILQKRIETLRDKQKDMFLKAFVIVVASSDRRTLEKINCDEKYYKKISKQCEISCYNKAVTICQKIREGHMFTNFINQYSQICYLHVYNIKSTEGYGLKILLKIIDSKKIADIKPEDISPELYDGIKLEIENRRKQVIEKKFLENTTCRNCKEKKVTCTEVQLNAGDEGSSFRYECWNESCGSKWISKS